MSCTPIRKNSEDRFFPSFPPSYTPSPRKADDPPLCAVQFPSSACSPDHSARDRRHWCARSGSFPTRTLFFPPRDDFEPPKTRVFQIALPPFQLHLSPPPARACNFFICVVALFCQNSTFSQERTRIERVQKTSPPPFPQYHFLREHSRCDFFFTVTAGSLITSVPSHSFGTEGSGCLPPRFFSSFPKIGTDT